MTLVKLENVQICQESHNWREAIKISTQPLENGGYVKTSYKDGIIENVEKLGPYFVISDDIAMPHARPEQGAIKTQIAITLFHKGVKFDGKNATPRLFITLSAKENNEHLEALAKISELLSNDAKVDKILKSQNEQTLYQYFENF